MKFTKEDIVAEIGCGTGVSAFSISTGVKQLIAFDISGPVVNALQRFATQNLSFVQGDACSVELAHNYAGLFTKVYSLETLEHVDSPHRFFYTVSQLLKPGGAAAILFSNVKWHGKMHFQSMREVENLADKNSLEVVELTTLEPTRPLRWFRRTMLEGPIGWYRWLKTGSRRRSREVELSVDRFDETFAFCLTASRRKWWHFWVRLYFAILHTMEKALFHSGYRNVDVDSLVNSWKVLVVVRKPRSPKGHVA